jgi:uncharacterized Tic20 family protein
MSEIITPASSDEKNIAVLTHLGGIFFCIFPALIVWLLKKDDSPYLSGQAREALNFQITIMLAYFIGWILAFILIGFLLLGIIWLTNIILSLLAAIAVSKGEDYHYPFSLRLIS